MTGLGQWLMIPWTGGWRSCQICSHHSQRTAQQAETDCFHQAGQYAPHHLAGASASDQPMSMPASHREAIALDPRHTDVRRIADGDAWAVLDDMVAAISEEAQAALAGHPALAAFQNAQQSLASGVQPVNVSAVLSIIQEAFVSSWTGTGTDAVDGSLQHDFQVLLLQQLLDIALAPVSQPDSPASAAGQGYESSTSHADAALNSTLTPVLVQLIARSSSARVQTAAAVVLGTLLQHASALSPALVYGLGHADGPGATDAHPPGQHGQKAATPGLLLWLAACLVDSSGQEGTAPIGEPSSALEYVQATARAMQCRAQPAARPAVGQALGELAFLIGTMIQADRQAELEGPAAGITHGSPWHIPSWLPPVLLHIMTRPSAPGAGDHGVASALYRTVGNIAVEAPLAVGDVMELPAVANLCGLLWTSFTHLAVGGGEQRPAEHTPGLHAIEEQVRTAQLLVLPYLYASLNSASGQTVEAAIGSGDAGASGLNDSLPSRQAVEELLESRTGCINAVAQAWPLLMTTVTAADYGHDDSHAAEGNLASARAVLSTAERLCSIACAVLRASTGSTGVRVASDGTSSNHVIACTRLLFAVSAGGDPVSAALQSRPAWAALLASVLQAWLDQLTAGLADKATPDMSLTMLTAVALLISGNPHEAVELLEAQGMGHLPVIDAKARNDVNTPAPGQVTDKPSLLHRSSFLVDRGADLPVPGRDESGAADDEDNKGSTGQGGPRPSASPTGARRTAAHRQGQEPLLHELTDETSMAGPQARHYPAACREILRRTVGRVLAALLGQLTVSLQADNHAALGPAAGGPAAYSPWRLLAALSAVQAAGLHTDTGTSTSTAGNAGSPLGTVFTAQLVQALAACLESVSHANIPNQTAGHVLLGAQAQLLDLVDTLVTAVDDHITGSSAGGSSLSFTGTLNSTAGSGINVSGPTSSTKRTDAHEALAAVVGVLLSALQSCLRVKINVCTASLQVLLAQVADGGVLIAVEDVHGTLMHVWPWLHAAYNLCSTASVLRCLQADQLAGVAAQARITIAAACSLHGTLRALTEAAPYLAGPPSPAGRRNSGLGRNIESVLYDTGRVGLMATALLDVVHALTAGVCDALAGRGADGISIAASYPARLLSVPAAADGSAPEPGLVAYLMEVVQAVLVPPVPSGDDAGPALPFGHDVQAACEVLATLLQTNVWPQAHETTTGAAASATQPLWPTLIHEYNADALLVLGLSTACLASPRKDGNGISAILSALRTATVALHVAAVTVRARTAGLDQRHAHAESSRHVPVPGDSDRSALPWAHLVHATPQLSISDIDALQDGGPATATDDGHGKSTEGEDVAVSRGGPHVFEAFTRLADAASELLPACTAVFLACKGRATAVQQLHATAGAFLAVLCRAAPLQSSFACLSWQETSLQLAEACATALQQGDDDDGSVAREVGEGGLEDDTPCDIHCPTLSTEDGTPLAQLVGAVLGLLRTDTAAGTGRTSVLPLLLQALDALLESSADVRVALDTVPAVAHVSLRSGQAATGTDSSPSLSHSLASALEEWRVRHMPVDVAGKWASPGSSKQGPSAAGAPTIGPNGAAPAAGPRVVRVGRGRKSDAAPSGAAAEPEATPGLISGDTDDGVGHRPAGFSAIVPAPLPLVRGLVPDHVAECVDSLLTKLR